jgi:hypothetical protein
MVFILKKYKDLMACSDVVCGSENDFHHSCKSIAMAQIQDQPATGKTKRKIHPALNIDMTPWWTLDFS